MKGLYKYAGSANWWFRYTPPGGKRKQVTLGTPDEAQAITRARAILAEGTLVRPEKGSIELVVDRYVAAAQIRNRKPMRKGTAKEAQRVLYSFIVARKLKYPTDVTIPNVQAWLDELRGAGRAQDTLASYARIICTFSRWLAAERLTSFHLLEKFERPQMSPKGRQNWVRREVVAKLIEEATDPDLKFILYCGFHAGLRKAEICAVRVGWFDLSKPEQPVLHVQNDPESEFFLKDSENRSVPLTDGFAAFLRVYLQDQLPTNYALEPAKARGVHKYRVEFKRGFDTFMRKQGVACTVHDMRRSFASNLVTHGTPIYTVAKWLGDGVEVVVRSYGHLESYSKDINRLIA